ncbi:plasmid mobilization protein [Streptococcus sobrinus]|uniref:plasmid mobilization protein n=1 Tax=Streptococcus sobrinus TaxID=1310 RepID=UPI0002D947A7|nr:plasmid mobilization relaxosome protein MobC [Streptococcus sobrinus]
MEDKKRKRYKQFILRTTEDEALMIRRKISTANLKTFQAFALKMLLNGEVVTVDYSELLSLRKEVNAIGQNVNQIARFANTLGELDKDLLLALQEEVKALSQIVYQEFSEGKVGKEHGRDEGSTN